MVQPALWICFYHRKGSNDQWALHMDHAIETECHTWQASGGALEFVANHSHGARCEALPNYKEKWLLKANLTDQERVIIRDSADNHPVDNEGEYWDCRVYCFELLGILEVKKVLKRDDGDYNQVRRRLHDKWRAEDGIKVRDSEGDRDSEVEPAHSVPSNTLDSDATNAKLKETSVDGTSQPKSQTENKKRALSHGSGDTTVSRDHTSTGIRTRDLRGIKRQKDE